MMRNKFGSCRHLWVSAPVPAAAAAAPADSDPGGFCIGVRRLPDGDVGVEPRDM